MTKKEAERLRILFDRIESLALQNKPSMTSWVRDELLATVREFRRVEGLQ